MIFLSHHGTYTEMMLKVQVQPTKNFLRSEKKSGFCRSFFVRNWVNFRPLLHKACFKELLKLCNWYFNTFSLKLDLLHAKMNLWKDQKFFLTKIAKKWAINLRKCYFWETAKMPNLAIKDNFDIRKRLWKILLKHSFTLLKS